jgi:hypothetical protein
MKPHTRALNIVQGEELGNAIPLRPTKQLWIGTEKRSKKQKGPRREV